MAPFSSGRERNCWCRNAARIHVETMPAVPSAFGLSFGLRTRAGMITMPSLAELNEAIAEERERLNDRPFQKLEGSRRSLLGTLERPALRPLPTERYEFAQWKKARANIDYHVQVDHNFYSVPHQLIHKEFDIRLTAKTVEVLYRGRRVASHVRSYGKGLYITAPRYRPASHRKHLEWTPSCIIHWAETIGPNTGELVKAIMDLKPHPEQGYRSCLGIMRLAKRYPAERIEAAARRAVAFGAISYKSLKAISEKGLDELQVEPVPVQAPMIRHTNLRGPAYYS